MLRGLTHSASCLLQRIGGGSHSHRLARAVPQAAMALNTGKPRAMLARLYVATWLTRHVCRGSKVVQQNQGGQPYRRPGW